jgi:hypothetical protein
MQKILSKAKWQCRVSPTLGALEDTAENIWGTLPYTNKAKPTVFMGIYSLKDFNTLWEHQGRRAILWCGSDIPRMTSGYWLDEIGSIKNDPQPLAEWIDQHCENYVENGVEHQALETVGIRSKIVPSFLGKVEDYSITYEKNSRPNVYLSVSGDNFAMYGWELVEMIADQCDVDFHLYGNTKPWKSAHSNVFVHGRVPKEEMNEEIKYMQCGLRTLEFDGFSEVLAKSVLWGQHPISYIGYEHITNYNGSQDNLINRLNNLVHKRGPNTVARDYYLKNLNKYPWNIYA